VKLVNPASGKALDINGAGTANGTNVQIWTVVSRSGGKSIQGR
jgi:hypothetical protein